MRDLDEVKRIAAQEPEVFRRSIAIIFRRLMTEERTGRRGRGKWTYEEAIEEALGLPRTSDVVPLIASEVRGLERSYRVEKFDDADDFDRLLDRFDKAVQKHL